MKKSDLIFSLKKLNCLNLCAIEIISVVIHKDLKMELLKSIQSQTSLGDINFKKGLTNLLENNILEWVPEKSHRKKALYYGKTLLSLGAKQIVKTYTIKEKKAANREISMRNLKNHPSNKKKNNALDASGSFWQDKGTGYSEPHHCIKQSTIINQNYLINTDKDIKQNFMIQFEKGLKIPTAHLYRKAMAKYVPQ